MAGDSRQERLGSAGSSCTQMPSVSAGLHTREASRRPASGWLHVRTFQIKTHTALVADDKTPKATLAKNGLSAEQ